MDAEDFLDLVKRRQSVRGYNPRPVEKAKIERCLEAARLALSLTRVRSLLPRAAVVDVNLPAMNGQQVTRQIALEKIPTRVILLTAYDDTEQKIHAMRSGASAYCTKDIQPEKLAWTIRQVLTGGFVVGERNTSVSPRCVNSRYFSTLMPNNT